MRNLDDCEHERVNGLCILCGDQEPAAPECCEHNVPLDDECTQCLMDKSLLDV